MQLEIVFSLTFLSDVYSADGPRFAHWAVSDFQARGHLVVGPRGEVHDKYMLSDWQPQTLVDLRGAAFMANENGPMKEAGIAAKWPDTAELKRLPTAGNEELYPVSIRGSAKDICLIGGKVIGVQPRALPWRVMKALYDGTAVRIEATGVLVVRDMEFENMQDGVRPRGTASWVVRGVCAKYVRDDFVENDSLLPGEIIDCYAEGHTFLSARPGKNSAADEKRMAEKARNPPHVKIRDCLAHVPLMPYDGDMKLSDQKYIVHGKAGGKLFKWSPNGGTVEVENTLFRVDGMSATGPTSMAFPKGTYKDVTLVWLGKGDYPAAVPPGVKVTRDVSVWDKAKADWFKRHEQPSR